MLMTSQVRSMLSIFLLLQRKPEPRRVAHAELRRTTTAAYLGSAPLRAWNKSLSRSRQKTIKPRITRITLMKR